MNILEVKKYDVVNGPGIRCSIWIAGCNNYCKDCWSSHTWNPNNGKPYKECVTLIKEAINNSKIDGISILGGDPFYSLFNGTLKDKEELKDLLRICSIKPLWVWTGYKYEDLCKDYSDYLSYIDVLIDGPFISKEKDLNLYYRGSSNQRIINVSQSLKENKVIEWNEKM